ncbi:hypothetical protein OHT76_42175 [Streptomyces sp. NBC_00287]|uniref:hypothetical protein n=1 Tax=Streptomyces sp. NBC_00287 TaxID=2975702 RepID=UPI002E2BFFF2|nr:hypothetical protein [Streptomyces sp. NBC_00287]
MTRLLNHRRVDVAWLASESGIPEDDLRSLSEGAPPLTSQLDALAPALGFHAADLYAIANVPAPAALRPGHPAAGSDIAGLVRITMALPPDDRTRVHRLVDQLPREPRDHPGDLPRPYSQHHWSAGALLVNLLCVNRNLYSVSAAAKALAVLTDGRVYLAASTIHGIGRGRVPLTPQRVAGFATTLGIPPADLAAITQIALPQPSWPDDPLTAEMARLLWNCRHLTAAQAKHVYAEVKSMLMAVPDNATDEEWNRVWRHHGTWWGAPRQ